MSTQPRFSRGKPEKSSSRPFEAVNLPESQKEELCQRLLAEFGARWSQRNDELIHGCLVTPTHTRQDTEPTASLNTSKLVYRCLGCGARGGILWLIATVRGCSTAEALEWLNSETGLGGQTMDLAPLLKYLDSVYQRKVRATVPHYSERILEPWAGIHPYLTDPRSTGYGREIPVENCIKARLGYAQEYVISRDALGTPTKVSERIVIPHFWKGNLVGWQTRRLANDGTPKYLSSPDFPKDQTLYNYDPAAERTVVVEAALSATSKAHLAHIEATFGATVTDDQVALLSKHPVIVLFMDNDSAGWNAVLGYDTYDRRGKLVDHKPGLGERLERSSVVLVVENPWDADAADLTDEDFLRLVECAVPFAAWRKPSQVLPYR